MTGLSCRALRINLVTNVWGISFDSDFQGLVRKHNYEGVAASLSSINAKIFQVFTRQHRKAGAARNGG